MNERLKIGLVQMSMHENKERNISKAVSMIEEAAGKGAEVVCLPELFSERYFPQYKKVEVKPEKIPGRTTRIICTTARRLGISIVAGSIYEWTEKGNYNTSVFINSEGRIESKYRKVHVPNDECFYEQLYFKKGNSYSTFVLGQNRLGTLICFDQWYPEPARILKLMGAEVIFYPSAIGTVQGIDQEEGSWKDAWIAVQRGHAIANSVIVACVNRVGNEDRMDFWGSSFVFDQFGKQVALMDGKEGTVVVECDLSLSSKIESGWGFMRNRMPKTYGMVVNGKS